MDKLFESAIARSKRTPVTTLFARNGFRISMTDFDQVVFEKDDVKVSARFDLKSNLESVRVLPK
ncbi:hypothetical protein ABMX68_21780 [Vibrio vulnificus]|uniref:hypothetical protein n=1 Tax=Vibrio vulnificus TaxID=672 RepID=UPI0032496981